jgi:hypothetical protein
MQASEPVMSLDDGVDTIAAWQKLALAVGK